jgi:hypothetical protein
MQEHDAKLRQVEELEQAMYYLDAFGPRPDKEAMSPMRFLEYAACTGLWTRLGSLTPVFSFLRETIGRLLGVGGSAAQTIRQ